MTTATVALKAELRDERGKEWAKKIRREGKIPGVLYGHQFESRAVLVDSHDLQLVRNATMGEQVLLTIELSDGTAERAFIKELQRDPVTSKIKHIDLLRVDPEHEVHIRVRVKQTGLVPEGVREGGFLECLQYRVMVSAFPEKVPGHIEVDLSDLKVGETIHVSDLPQIEGVRYLDDEDTAIFTVLGKISQGPIGVEEGEEGETSEGQEAAAEGGEEES